MSTSATTDSAETRSQTAGLTVLIGAPGSGKTTHAARRWGYLVSSDAIRKEWGNEEDQTRNSEVFAELHRRVRTHLTAGRSVTVDATNTKPAERADLLAIAAETGTEWTLAVIMRVPLGTCLDRNNARTRHVPEDFIREAHARVARLTRDQLHAEGFAHIEVRDADGTLTYTSDHRYPAGTGSCALCAEYATATTAA